MPLTNNTNPTGALSFTTNLASPQGWAGAIYDPLVNNTTTTIWTGQVVKVILDTSINANGLPAVSSLVATCTAAASQLGSRYGIALNDCVVTNASSTSTFQAVNKVGGPQIVDVARGGFALVALTSGTVAAGGYVFPSTSGTGLCTTTANYNSFASTASAWQATQALGVVLSTSPLFTNSTGQALYLCDLG